jgi:small GTP-binding protein
VGKTSVVNRHANKEFQSTYKVTIGADQFPHRLVVDGREYQYTIWDTAGQEKFRTLLDIFYKGSDGCFIVFDVTDRRTFERVMEWKNQFLSKTDIDPRDGFQFVVLGNKCDLSAREVSTEEAQRFFSDNSL